MASEPLFHYTNQAGLLGILENNCLWATSVRHLNDSSEYSYGLDLIRKILKSRCSDTQYRRLIESTLEKYDGVCVASLTEEGDILSQWRAYGGGSGGIALGFQRDHLRKVAARESFELQKCIYLPDEQQAAIEDLLNRTCSTEMQSLVAQLSDQKSQSGFEANCGILGLILALRLKDESFKEEREWRLISMPKPISNWEFRPGVSMLIPYVKFPLGSDRNAYLQDVIVGPTPHRELAVDSVKTLLLNRKLSHADVMVKPTRIPYRNW